MAVAYVASHVHEALSGGSTETDNFTIAAGTDLLLLVFVVVENTSGPTVTGVTFNSVALTEHTNSPFQHADADAFAADIAVFSLADPDTGSAHDLVATFSSASGQDVVLVSVILSGADSVSASGFATEGATVDSDRSVSITTANDDSLIVALANHRASDDSPFSSSTATEREDGATATGVAGEAYALYTQAAGAAGAKTVTITGQNTTGEGWNTVAIEVVEAVGGGGVTIPVLYRHRRVMQSLLAR